MTQKTPKVVVVTGASGALGSVVAKKFLEAGCRVIGIEHRKKEPLAKGVEWIEMDLTDPAQVRDRFPTDADAVIHCAGGFRWVKTDEFKDEDLEFLLNINLKSSFLLARAVLPGMKKRGFGRIVFIGAKATFSPAAGMGLYAASKIGLNALTLALAEEVKGSDINVNAILPSIIDTPANRSEMPKADFSAWVPPSELADIIFSLTQPWGKSIHGALIPVSGRV